ncbi:hypothetical protein EWM64_g8261, partial [Hericium alpestre]
MGRELRPRKSRQSYASLFVEEDENGAGPSVPKATFDEDGDSESDFTPAEAEAAASEDEEITDADLLDEQEGAIPLDTNEREGSFASSTSTAPAGRVKGKSSSKKPTEKKSASVTAPGVSRPQNRQMYSLPTPSVHHRHKAIPIFHHIGPVERLVHPPRPFAANETVPTNNYTTDDDVIARLNKAWGYNVGPGPLWELLEDRGWYKEALIPDEGQEKEENRRPRVYQDVVLQSFSVLDPADAAPYLPKGDSSEDMSQTSPLSCYLGPFAKQTLVQMNMFDSLPISQFIPESKSHVFNAGGPVWGLDWCPIHPFDRPHCSFRQYLAIAPFSSTSYSPTVGKKAARPSYACIQIWSLGPSRKGGEGNAAATDGDDEHGEMRCEMILCVESGPAFELKWCPLPSHDLLSASPSDSQKRKLGLLGGTFEDGSVSIYAVPYPADLRSTGDDPASPVFVRLFEPLVRIELEETFCWSFDWANSEVIAVGCTNGVIAVYDVGRILKAPQGSNQDILPTHYIPVHQSAIRAISWVRAPPSSMSGETLTNEDPTIIASGGYDGMECLTDIRELSGNFMNRTRDVINIIPYSPYAGGPVTIDRDNIVKLYSVSPSMLGRGHMLIEPMGPVWCASPSDYHPQLAVGSADGCCSTTNMLRSTRRGGSVPFLTHKIYQLDYSRSAKTFRMLERFLPQEMPDRSS